MKLSTLISKKLLVGEDKEIDTKVAEKVTAKITDAITKATGIKGKELVKEAKEVSVVTCKGELPLSILSDEVKKDVLEDEYQNCVVEASADTSPGTMDYKIGRAFAANSKLLGTLKVLVSTEDESDLF
jgi:hypothetical protein